MIIKEDRPIYDLSKIKEKNAVWAKHKTWSEGKVGLIAIATEDSLVIQFQPTIRNVTNHFKIPVTEAAAGEWEIRISGDLKDIITL